MNSIKFREVKSASRLLVLIDHILPATNIVGIINHFLSRIICRNFFKIFI